MKRFIVAITLGLALCEHAGAKPAALWQNFGYTNKAPQVDAIAFENRGQIVLTNTMPTQFTIVDLNQIASTVYDTQNTLYFTNRGAMVGTLGFQFDTVKPGPLGWQRVPALVFTNSGSIAAVDNNSDYYSGVYYYGLLSYGTIPVSSSYLGVRANKVGNNGLMTVGDAGVMQIAGKEVNLSEGALAAGTISSMDTNFDSGSYDYFGYWYNSTGRGFFVIPNQYVNATGVQDIYWEALGTNSLSLFSLMLGSPTTGWMPYNPFSSYTNSALFQAWAYTDVVGTNTYVNVVFVRTNDTSSNFTADVRFSQISEIIAPGNTYDFGGVTAVVKLGSVSADVITGQVITNAFFLVDSGAEQTTFVLYTNALSPPLNPTGRPSCYDVTTAVPFEWYWGYTNNIDYTPDLFWPGPIPGEQFVNQYATGPFAYYGAQVGRGDTSSGLASYYSYYYYGFLPYLYGSYTNTVHLNDPTNEPARIEISSDSLNLSNVRIRSEGMLTMKTKHLVPGAPASIDAGNMGIDFASTNGTLCVSNVLPSVFKRARGQIYCWSANWTNHTTNVNGGSYFKYHVLVVDHSVQGEAIPQIRDLALRAANIYAQDTLHVNKSSLFDATNITFNGPVSLVEEAESVGGSNMPKVKTLTVETNGVFYVQNRLQLDKSTKDGGLIAVTNKGIISGSVVQITSALMENAGKIHTSNSLFLNITNQITVGRNSLLDGTLILTTNENPELFVIPGTVETNALPVPAHLFSEWDTEIIARIMRANHSVISNGMTGSGTLKLTVTEELSDGVLPVAGTNDVIINNWNVRNGFQLTTKPRIGDLYGTKIRTISDGYRRVTHMWAGEDRGPTVSGFTNNAVIGHLVLDRLSTNSILEFWGAGARSAMYVDYLEFADAGYDDYNHGLRIRPNMVIYFADSNVDPGKLANSFPGQIVWVPQWTGPNSSVSIRTRNSDRTVNDVLANRRLVTTWEIDSDNDGKPNQFDTFPLDGTFLTTLCDGPGKVLPDLNNKSLIVGSNYSISAVADPGYLFSYWVQGIPVLANNDDGSVSPLRVANPDGTQTNLMVFITNTTPSITFAMQPYMVAQAKFVPDPECVHVAIVGSGTVTPSVNTRLVAGRTYTITAIPAAGSVFTGWSGDLASSKTKLTFVMRPGLTLQATFAANVLSTLKGSYGGLFYGMTAGQPDVNLENSGSFVVNVTEAGAASGKVIMSSGTYPFTATFSPSGTTQAVVKRGKLAPLTLTMTLLDDGNYSAIGSVGDGQSWVSTLQGAMYYYDGKSTKAPAAGSYTFVLPSVSQDLGEGWATAKVDSKGKVVITGTLADGTKMSASAVLYRDSHMPLYFVKSGKQTLLSMVAFDANDNSVPSMGPVPFIGLSGKAFWSQENGVSSAADLYGSWYVAPQRGAVSLAMPDPVLELTAGGLVSDWLGRVTYNPTTQTYASADKKVVLKLKTSNGTFTGTYSVGGTRTLQGVVLPRQNAARGFFNGANHTSGSVLLHNSP